MPDTPPYNDTHSSVPTSVEAEDRFLDLLTATGCEAAVDANASFARPGPRLVDGVEALAAILHPGAGVELDPRMARRIR